ncbi:hypothetical protein ACET3Z_027347 [Daucus carota]
MRNCTMGGLYEATYRGVVRVTVVDFDQQTKIQGNGFVICKKKRVSVLLKCAHILGDSEFLLISKLSRLRWDIPSNAWKQLGESSSGAPILSMKGNTIGMYVVSTSDSDSLNVKHWALRLNLVRDCLEKIFEVPANWKGRHSLKVGKHVMELLERHKS